MSLRVRSTKYLPGLGSSTASSYCIRPTNKAHSSHVQAFIQAQTLARCTACTSHGGANSNQCGIICRADCPASTTAISSLSSPPLPPKSARGPARPGRVLMERFWSLLQQDVRNGTEADWPARATAAPVFTPASEKKPHCWHPHCWTAAGDFGLGLSLSSSSSSYLCSFFSPHLKFCRHCRHWRLADKQRGGWTVGEVREAGQLCLRYPTRC
jgi:hypothetical protein